ncbi:peptide-methionine (S)-S-oxide reductase MsrA [Pelagibaculum spongiae]|uniref:Peptide methionine sulfoxide reductase MsrA n=1 Tax=Pelagibaculum spongiae TaxID=2080658 RepID=A0A2V1GYS0_9GAMM|nr:peptide-methionine (S)-S-oxide reductase MsrA [Pelagibaculum spongiae]PVZ66279.1 peptide-methionine (S)-S-oxide reductase [Pelagibaculum spongiae]
MLKKISLLPVLLLISTFSVNAQEKAEAIFASGCFWCTESDFEKVEGVIEAVSGYTDGRQSNPTYKQVSAGRTGHTEAVKVTYDPSKVSYEKLLSVFWHNVDPTVKNRQFCDSGSQYRSGIYYLNPEQQAAAEKSLVDLKASGRFERIYTELKPASKFYPAEDYHQDYAKKNPWRYKYYRSGCGRDDRLKRLWGELALEH